MTFYRDNKKMTKSATLRNNQGSTAITRKGDFASLGCAFKKLSDETKSRLELSNGVQVTGLGKGLLQDNGVREGFIITEVNNRNVNTSDDVEAIYDQVMKSSDPDKLLLLKGIYPTGKRSYYAIDLAEE